MTRPIALLLVLVVGVILVLWSFRRARRAGPQASGTPLSRGSKWADPWLIDHFAQRLKELSAARPEHYRMSGRSEDLAVLAREITVLDSLRAEVERERGQRPIPRQAAEALGRILTFIAQNLESLKELERVNRHMQRFHQLVGPDSELDALLSFQRDLERDRPSFQEPQTKSVIDDLIIRVKRSRMQLGDPRLPESGRSESRSIRPNEWITRADDPGYSGFQVEALAKAGPSPAESEREAEGLMVAAEVLLGYGWAFEPAQAASLAAALDQVRQGLRTSASLDALRRAMDSAPEPLCALLFLRHMISLKVEGEEPAAVLMREVAGMEAAYQSGHPPTPHELEALVDRIQQSAQSGHPPTPHELEALVDRIQQSARAAVPGAVPAGGSPSGRSSSAKMPAALTDRVHFSVAAPPTVLPGASFVVDVWAHLERHREEVVRRIRESVTEVQLLAHKGPVRLARGTILTVHLRIDDLIVEDPEDTLLWDAEIGTASFPVKVPPESAPGGRAASFTVHVNGVQIAKLHFSLSVGPAAAPAASIPVREDRHRRAFASYASADRDEVLSIIQGIQKGVPGLDVFLDVAGLRSGERWQDRLREEINARDVLYLFWSVAAMESPWVEREWRYAYESRGLDFIDPVPLVSPELAPPPAELADLHFNDWVHAFKRRQRYVSG